MAFIPERIKSRRITADGNVIPRKTVFPAKSFRDVTCLPVTRRTPKTLVTKENPNMATGAPSFEYYKLVFVPKPRLGWRISFL